MSTRSPRVVTDVQQSHRVLIACADVAHDVAVGVDASQQRAEHLDEARQSTHAALQRAAPLSWKTAPSAY